MSTSWKRARKPPPPPFVVPPFGGTYRLVAGDDLDHEPLVESVCHERLGGLRVLHLRIAGDVRVHVVEAQFALEEVRGDLQQGHVRRVAMPVHPRLGPPLGEEVEGGQVIPLLVMLLVHLRHGEVRLRRRWCLGLGVGQEGRGDHQCPECSACDSTHLPAPWAMGLTGPNVERRTLRVRMKCINAKLVDVPYCYFEVARRTPLLLGGRGRATAQVARMTPRRRQASLASKRSSDARPRAANTGAMAPAWPRRTRRSQASPRGSRIRRHALNRKATEPPPA